MTDSRTWELRWQPDGSWALQGRGAAAMLAKNGLHEVVAKAGLRADGELVLDLQAANAVGEFCNKYRIPARRVFS